MSRVPVTRIMSHPCGVGCGASSTCAMFSPSASDEPKASANVDRQSTGRPGARPKPVLVCRLERPAEDAAEQGHEAERRNHRQRHVPDLAGRDCRMSRPSANRKRPMAAITG